MTGTSKTGFEAVVTQKVGPVEVTFKGAVKLKDVYALQSYHIVGKGKGSVAEFAKGATNLTLTEIKGGSELSYNLVPKLVAN